MPRSSERIQELLAEKLAQQEADREAIGGIINRYTQDSQSAVDFRFPLLEETAQKPFESTQILPWEPSPTEKRKQWIAENVYGSMDNRYRANRLSQGIVDVADMIPFYGDVEGAREGYHLATEENSPWLGAGLGALGVLPFIPGSVTRKGGDFLKEQAAKLKVTPTKYTVEDTSPRGSVDSSEVERLISREGFDDEAMGFKQQRRRDPDEEALLEAAAATVGQPFTIETMAERSILNNKQFQNPNKKYSVRGLIQSTVNDVPGPARANLERQLNEWIPEEMKEGKATLQEVLDEIGRNKPSIHQQVDSRPNAQLAREEVEDGRSYLVDDEGYGYTHQRAEEVLENAFGAEYMPMLPTNEIPTNIDEAERILPLLRYTEKSVSVSPDNLLFYLPEGGHPEVGAGVRKGDVPGFDRGRNETNRIFHTRSGVYEVEGGKRVLIPAEGQSGMYGMRGTDRKDEILGEISEQRFGEAPLENRGLGVKDIQARLVATEPEGMYVKLDLSHYDSLDADAGEYLETTIQPNLIEGKTIEDWKAEVASYRNALEEQLDKINRKHGFTTETVLDWDIEATPIDEVYDMAVSWMERELDAAKLTRNTKLQDLKSEFDDGAIHMIAYKDGEEEADRAYEAVYDTHRRTAQAKQEKKRAKADVAGTFAAELQALLKQPKHIITDLNPPMLQDWFPMHMKMSLNDAAVDKRIDAVRFPINEYALQKQTGMNNSTTPARMEKFRDQEWQNNTKLAIPEKTAQRRGRQYTQKTNEAIKRIEAEYGIKLNVKEITDDNRNKFLEVDITDEIREAFQTVLMSNGGPVADRVTELLDATFRK
tara:strand:- start:2740 stop:5208 length:2469 start_codon:yes stop_codon:yes gene_type:complete